MDRSFLHFFNSFSSHLLFKLLRALEHMVGCFGQYFSLLSHLLYPQRGAPVGRLSKWVVGWCDGPG